jgi:flagellar hook-basal body complex protein FliE
MGSPLSGVSLLSQVRAGVETGKLVDGRSDFFSQLQKAFNQVGQLQTEANQPMVGLLKGRGEDIHQAWIAVEKANLAFQLMMQVRNKVIEAYEEVPEMAF